MAALFSLSYPDESSKESDDEEAEDNQEADSKDYVSVCRSMWLYVLCMCTFSTFGPQDGLSIVRARVDEVHREKTTMLFITLSH